MSEQPTNKGFALLNSLNPVFFRKNYQKLAFIAQKVVHNQQNIGKESDSSNIGLVENGISEQKMAEFKMRLGRELAKLKSYSVVEAYDRHYSFRVNNGKL
jgi:hypothetical protein